MNRLQLTVVLFISSLMIMGDLDAKPSSSRSSFSRSSSSRSSKPTFSKSKTTATKSTTTGTRTTSQTTKSTVKRTPTQAKAYEAAKSKGKAFNSKSAAVADFKSKAKTDPKTQAALAKSYPTKYDKEPATRPAHIPATYNNQTVIYQNGGYGYSNNGVFTALATYMLIDTMTDSMRMNAMQQQGYYYDSPGVQHHNSGSGFLAVIGLFCFVAFIILIVIVASTNG